MRLKYDKKIGRDDFINSLTKCFNVLAHTSITMQLNPKLKETYS